MAKLLLFIFLLLAIPCMAQPSADVAEEMVLIKKVDHTSVKDQANSSTCWSFSTNSLVESQSLKAGLGEFDLSEMFIVRNIYVEKAKNYILRQGHAQFGPGGLGHDVINAIQRYGALPESVYSGLLLGKKSHDHNELDLKLKNYLDNVLKAKPFPADWLKGFENILDDHLGKVPESFVYREKSYNPLTFASEILKFKSDDYIYITSFSHHPYYSSFVLEVPDNYSNGMYYNLPLNEMIVVAEQAIEKGFSVVWDGDVSNPNFRVRNGIVQQLKDPKNIPKSNLADAQEEPFDSAIRQQRFENLSTQDDHLMHIVGLERSKGGKRFFLVKNSYGEAAPFNGYINISEAYFAINTISLVVPKSALDSSVKLKLGL